MSGEERAAARSTAASSAGPNDRRSWAGLYALVIAALAVDILLLWWLTERYR